MARQRRFAPHHRNHHHHNNQQSQHQNHSVDPPQHPRLVNDNCVTAAAAQANTGNWVYWDWPAVAAGGVASNPPLLPGDVAMVHHPVDRPAMQVQTYQRQVATDRRQGWKPEKNLRFLLQKVLKQSDVGNLGRIVLPKLIRGVKVRQSGPKSETKRAAKSHKNQHANSPAAANGSSASPTHKQ
ncbi:hypothetical protein COLO4_36332 [Corchorus olitorius]|uniref:Uncharacterized protein n=1 Tax=Corchorus olitorius TaxID=93759 RepID=A0A1R3G9S9_9ROSI|nr:hypothetical protein COLO4_36332 [Corchorus olitorius]